jgi:hypothetical protein
VTRIDVAGFVVGVLMVLVGAAIDNSWLLWPGIGLIVGNLLCTFLSRTVWRPGKDMP